MAAGPIWIWVAYTVGSVEGEISTDGGRSLWQNKQNPRVRRCLLVAWTRGVARSSGKHIRPMNRFSGCRDIPVQTRPPAMPKADWLESFSFVGPACDTTPKAQCSDDCAPSVAFIVAGHARGFAERNTHLAYKQLVVDAFNANTRSRVFLYLRDLNATREQAQALISSLKPVAAVRFEDGPALNSEDIGRLDRRCLVGRWRDVGYIGRALKWWTSMNQSWSMVAAYEEEHGPFDRVVFSRPDIEYLSNFGPCANKQHSNLTPRRAATVALPPHCFALPVMPRLPP